MVDGNNWDIENVKKQGRDLKRQPVSVGGGGETCSYLT